MKEIISIIFSPIYQTIPIDNINSNVGISIDEIFSSEAKEKYKKDFNEALNTLSDSKKRFNYQQ